jgi:hypothetical protein
LLRALLDADGDVAEPLDDRVGATAVLGLEPLDARAFVDAALDDEQRVSSASPAPRRRSPPRPS